MTQAAVDEALMKRALAEGARGRTSPNPHVGAVVARGERIISVGHHEGAGLDHAEVDAIQNAAGDTAGATLYCTLEPCNHTGRTGPCTEAVIAAKFARVVIGCADPSPPRPGAVAKMQAAGIEVVTGVLEADARALIADWAHTQATGLPYVVLKAAVTLDGRIAARTGDSRWITGEASRAEAHRLRDQCDAVLVGVGTVIADDPSLNVRHVEGRDPVRVVLDSELRTPPGAKVVTQPSSAPTWILHGTDAPAERRAALQRDGVELLEVALEGRRLDTAEALRALVSRGVVRVLAEGGSKVHGALLRAGLAHEAAIFVAPKLLGDAGAIPLADAGPLGRIADGWRLLDPRIRVLGTDVLFQGALAGPSSSAVL